MTYSEKLRDPRWQKKRLKVMEYAKFRCQICGTKNKTLNVHHSYYESNKEPWEYPNGSLICICQDCHELITESQKEKRTAQTESDLIAPVSICETLPDTIWSKKTRLLEMKESTDEREQLFADVALEILQHRPLISSWFEAGKIVELGDAFVRIVFPANMSLVAESLERPNNRLYLERVFQMVCGHSMVISIVMEDVSLCA